MTTLIVRDATLAVNGAPELRGDTREHIRNRILEVGRLDSASVAACVDVLESVAGSGTSDDADPEVLLALMLLGLAHPDQVENLGVSAVACGRRVAARHEQSGDPDSALAIIEILREERPEHAALERDYEAILRRLGMVNDLADRYFARAQHLLKQGKAEEAAGWLKEVLLLDRSRKDVARMIRDLRLEKAHAGERRKGLNRILLVALTIPVVLGGIVFREKRLSDRFAAIPAAIVGDLESVRARRDALEAFVEGTSVWHGAFAALSERSKLRIAVGTLEEEQRVAQEALESLVQERYERAEILRRRGRMNAEVGDFKTALDDFEAALLDAPEDWEHRERVERDIAAITKLLAADGGSEG